MVQVDALVQTGAPIYVLIDCDRCADQRMGEPGGGPLR